MQAVKKLLYDFHDTNENIPLHYDLFINDELYNAYSQHSTGRRTLYEQNNLHELNPALVINRFLGHELITDKMTYYVVRSAYSPVPASNDFKRFKDVANFVGLNYEFVTVQKIGSYQPETYSITGYCSNNSTITPINLGGFRYENNEVKSVQAYNCNENYFTVGINYATVLYIDVYPSDIITTTVNYQGKNTLTFYVALNFFVSDNQIQYCSRIRIDEMINYSSGQWNVRQALTNWNSKHAGIVTDDLDNPYGINGTSTTGGGDGTLNPGDIDLIEKAGIPDLPSLGAASCGFLTMYAPTVSQLRDLSDFMWSDAFDMDTYKKLFADPMESIIGLAIVPVSPSLGATKNVTFGTIDSGISMSTIANQYVKIDCGSVNIEKYIGCFMDYAPYTKISIFLPYIGIRELSADDVTDGSINVQYIVDVLTGACACFIESSTKGVLYSYNGSCITNVPLTAANFSGAIQNAVSAVISGVGVIAGMATGAAPISAMGAMGLLNSAANTALNSKPTIQRSGNLGGSAGIMSIQRPYVIIERPNLSVPDNVQHFVGQTSNLNVYLGNCSGFTLVEYIHLNGLSATADELNEIDTLLKQGVIYEYYHL